jgi:hypothetical protein
MRASTRPLLIAAATVVLACGQHRQGTDLLSLERALVHNFHTDAISVREQHSSIPPSLPAIVLTVAFTSSDAVMLAGADRAAFSKHVAEYVRDHYSAYPSLDRIDVRFGELPRAGSPPPPDTTQSYSFTRAELGAPSMQTGNPRL